MNLRFIKALNLLALVFFTGTWALAQTKTLPEPDLADVQYGIHERNVLDIWFADTTKITPLAIHIHGGGFVSVSKEQLSPDIIQELLESGISVAAINYRFLSDAPLPAAHDDALLALQFIRSKAEVWKIDKEKIAAFGASAGAQLSMWLAFCDDPPIFMSYRMKPDAAVPSEPGKARGWKIHHVNFGIKLKEKMDELGVEADLKYPGADSKYKSNIDFLKSKLL